MLTLKRQSRSGSISRFLGNPVRIFHSLLFICALEVRSRVRAAVHVIQIPSGLQMSINTSDSRRCVSTFPIRILHAQRERLFLDDRWFHFAFFPFRRARVQHIFQKCCAQAFTIHLSLPHRYCSGRSVYSLANLLSVGVVQREPTTREKR